MKKIIYLFTPIFIVITIISGVIAPAINMSEDISQKVFRLHIRANSDSDEDQKIKLIVRDELLDKTKDLFNGCSSVCEAVKRTNNNISFIENTVNKIIKIKGFNYNCTVKTDKEYFETRKYESFTLPAGIYDALIIELGQGKGHNWWCVMFPAVCISGCTDEFDSVLTEEEKKMIEEDKYVVKFKIVEVYERLKSVHSA